VRYKVLAIACVLAVLTYINRLGFGVAAPEIKKDLSLTDDQMGYLASVFLAAYGLCQVPGGLLGDRFGTRHLLTILVLAWSLLSGATDYRRGGPAVCVPADRALPVRRIPIGGISEPRPHDRRLDADPGAGLGPGNDLDVHSRVKTIAGILPRSRYT
jgi:hypothetical protein